MSLIDSMRFETNLKLEARRKKDVERLRWILREYPCEEFFENGDEYKERTYGVRIQQLGTHYYAVHSGETTDFSKTFLYKNRWDKARIDRIAELFCDGLLKKSDLIRTHKFQKFTLPLEENETQTEFFIVPLDRFEKEQTKKALLERALRKREDKQNEKFGSYFRKELRKNEGQIKYSMVNQARRGIPWVQVAKKRTLGKSFDFAKIGTERFLSKMVREEFPSFKDFELRITRKKENRFNYIVVCFHW